MKKRYTIFNRYIQGSNQSPQACHCLNNLWKSKSAMTQKANALFEDWAFNSQVEIMLQGPEHEDLEKLFDVMQNIKDLPCALFHESVKALNGACTAVTFVASERITTTNDYIRNNRLTYANAREILKQLSPTQLGLDEKLTDDEIFLAWSIAFLSLA